MGGRPTRAGWRSQAIEAERRELSPGGFARERLNLWPTDRVEQVFDMEQWAALVSPGPPDGTPPSAIAVDASPDRAMAIAGAWLLDGDGCHVELLAADYVSDPLNALQYVVERAGRRIPVVIDGASPAASMVPAPEGAEVQGDRHHGARYGPGLRRFPRRRRGRAVDARGPAAAGRGGGGRPQAADR